MKQWVTEKCGTNTQPPNPPKTPSIGNKIRTERRTMNNKLVEIVKVLLFIKNLTMTDIEKKINISYTALRNFLIFKSKMKIENLESLFSALDFPLITALKLAEQDLTRVELIKKILEEVQNDK